MAEITKPPVVTILGHVDHGKTTLLDFIRKSSVAAKEYGGITQAIGAYQVEVEGRAITFVDTPGHAAFEKMRLRGAEVADIAVLVVAVDDGVMPQTVEAIKHIQKVGIPMVVAVTKTDLPGVDIKVQLEKIKKQLSDHEVLVEEYGGDVPVVPLSGKTGNGVKDLLETIILVADIHELKVDPDRPATGIVLDAHLDKYKGAVATVLVRDGTLKKGETIIAGGVLGKVRGMFDWAGKAVDLAGPSVPVEVLGFGFVPLVGSRLGEKERPETLRQARQAKVKSLVEKLRESGTEVLNLVAKADKEGSLEAIDLILNNFNKEDQHIKVISSGTGDITDSDVEIASASKAIVIGFNVSMAPTARKLSEAEHVLVRTYKVIYELAEELEDVVEGMLKVGKVEEVFGRAQIMAEFPYGKEERIAGCRVLEGTISKGPRVRVVRDGEIIAEGKIKSLKKVKEEVPRVEKGQDCGIMFEPAIDFRVGDIIESFRTL